MKAQLLIFTFFMTFLFVKAKLTYLPDNGVWITAANKACQLTCQDSAAKFISTIDDLGSLEQNCDTVCSCGKQVYLPDETECTGYGTSDKGLRVKVFGKCASGMCSFLPLSQHR